MRRRTVVVVLAGLAVVVTVGAWLLWPQPDRITKGNVNRIGKGMSRAQVEAILGSPGDYAGGPTRTVPWNPVVNSQEDLVEWWTDTGRATVAFDRQSQVVVWVVYFPCSRIPQGALENLMWRIERLQYNWYKRRGLIVH
jgi:hypothetical protein